MKNSIRNASPEALEVLGSLSVSSDPANEQGVDEFEPGIYRRFRYTRTAPNSDLSVLFTVKQTPIGNIIDVVYEGECDRYGNLRDVNAMVAALYIHRRRQNRSVR